MDYINYSTQLAEGWWERGSFVRHWWSIYESDRRWAPFLYQPLRGDLVTTNDPYFERRQRFLLSLEALPRSRRSKEGGYDLPSVASMEQKVAAVVGLIDPDRSDGTAYAALLHCINHEETMERLYAALQEQIAGYECFRIVGPTGLSPHDPRTGILCNCFDRVPPFFTPYNPPYVTELVESVMTPLLEMRLYHIDIVAEQLIQSEPQTLGRIEVIDPQRLLGDLFPLFQSAYLDHPEFAPPERAEAAYLLRQWSCAPFNALTLWHENVPIGLVLLQPDLGKALCRAKGGRNPLQRLWLHWLFRQPVKAGRMLLGTVDPDWRHQGVGRQLWQAALKFAGEQGWSHLAIGPVVEDSEAAAFLEAMGAQPEQRYRLYTSEE
ncbi:MAG: GNAT family N-acetyltransferase [Caldilineaceae bacterium]